MKLSNIVLKLNEMESLLDSLHAGDIIKPLEQVLHEVENSEMSDDFVRSTRKQLERNVQSVNNTIKLLQDAIEWHQELRTTAEPELFNNSYNLWRNEMVHDTDETILNRQLNFDIEHRKYIENRVLLYGDWKHSGLIIAPRDSNFIDHLVGLDPLYLVDERESLFENTRNKFKEAYQQRLRYLEIDERDIENPVLSNIPDGQIGYALIYNFFHYKPIEVIQRYLEELSLKIKPGGTVAFTFNDCDRYGGVALAERSFCCYTPSEYIEDYAEDAGFQVYNRQPIDQATTWIELRMPGTLTSIKGGQSLIQIKHK